MHVLSFFEEMTEEFKTMIFAPNVFQFIFTLVASQSRVVLISSLSWAKINLADIVYRKCLDVPADGQQAAKLLSPLRLSATTTALQYH